MGEWGKGLSFVLASASEWVGSTIQSATGGQKPLRSYLEHLFDPAGSEGGGGSNNKAHAASSSSRQDRTQLQRYCLEQLASLRQRLLLRFALFLQSHPQLSYEMDLLNATLPKGVVLHDIAGTKELYRFYKERDADEETISCVQLFYSIHAYLELLCNNNSNTFPSSSISSASSTSLLLQFSTVDLRFFLDSLQKVDNDIFFSALAQTKLWYVYDVPKLLVLVTNLLYIHNDISFITLLNTMDGFLELWSVLKLNSKFTDMISKLEIMEEGRERDWALVFEIFSVLQAARRSYPAESLSTFKFSFELTMERLKFLAADPNEFELLEVIGSGADGLVRKMRYRGKVYAVKSIYPYFERDQKKKERKRKKSMSAGTRIREDGFSSVGLEYMDKERMEQLAAEKETKDDFWNWLYSQLGEYISMLILPRPNFVKLFHCYVGSFPPPPRYYCPKCFQLRFVEEKEEALTRGDGMVIEDEEKANSEEEDKEDDKAENEDKETRNSGNKEKGSPSPQCATCGNELSETLYGKEALHLVMEYCPLSSLRSYLDDQLLPSEAQLEASSSPPGESSSSSSTSTSLCSIPIDPPFELDSECLNFGVCLPQPKVVNFLCQILAALTFYHARGAIHEDLKPENILLRDESTLCLADFGLSTFLTQEGERNHGSPNYNPPEINSSDPLPSDYDYSKKDVWAAGCIALELLGFQIPVKNVSKALSMLQRILVPQLHQSLAKMLHEDFRQRSSALQSLIELENLRKYFQTVIDPTTAAATSSKKKQRKSSSPKKKKKNKKNKKRAAEGQTATEVKSLEAMADVMHRYQLVDHAGQTIPLQTVVKTDCTFKDYTEEVSTSATFYLSLLESSHDMTTKTRCMLYLARMVSDERMRVLILDMKLVERMVGLLTSLEEKQQNISQNLVLSVVDTFHILVEPGTKAETSQQVMQQMLQHNLFKILLRVVKRTKLPLLFTAIENLMKRCFYLEMPYEYFEQHIKESLWRLAFHSNSLSVKAFALQLLGHALPAFPKLVLEAEILPIVDMCHVASSAVDKMEGFLKLCGYTKHQSRFHQYITLLNTTTSSHRLKCPNTPGSSKNNSSNLSGNKRRRSIHQRCRIKQTPNGQIIIENEEEPKDNTLEQNEPTIKKSEGEPQDREEELLRLLTAEESHQRLMCDAFMDVVAKSSSFTQLRGQLTAIVKACQGIYNFYTIAEFPMECTACSAVIREKLYRCATFGFDFCGECWGKQLLPPELGSNLCSQYKREHWKKLKSVHVEPNRLILSKLSADDDRGDKKLNLKDSFMHNQLLMRAVKCPKCAEKRGIHIDACNYVFCTKCGFRFCFRCRKKWDLPNLINRHENVPSSNNSPHKKSKQKRKSGNIKLKARRAVPNRPLPPLPQEASPPASISTSSSSPSPPSSSRSSRSSSASSLFYPKIHLPKEQAQKALRYFRAKENNIFVNAFKESVDESNYELAMKILFSFVQRVAAPECSRFTLDDAFYDGCQQEEEGTNDGSSSTTTSTCCCSHSLFNASEIFNLFTRCNGCGGVMDSAQVGVITGVCGHIFCNSCSVKSALQAIATGNVHLYPNGYYGIECPLKYCKKELLSDPHLLQTLLPSVFYELYQCVATLLTLKVELKYASCALCGRKGVLNWEGCLVCYHCSDPNYVKPLFLDKEGYLQKRSGGLFPQWETQYFVLRKGKLSFHKRPPVQKHLLSTISSAKEQQSSHHHAKMKEKGEKEGALLFDFNDKQSLQWMVVQDSESTPALESSPPSNESASKSPTTSTTPTKQKKDNNNSSNSSSFFNFTIIISRSVKEEPPTGAASASTECYRNKTETIHLSADSLDEKISWLEALASWLS